MINIDHNYLNMHHMRKQIPKSMCQTNDKVLSATQYTKRNYMHINNRRMNSPAHEQ